MNPIAEEIKSYYGSGNDENFLEHYGMPRRSGRYPWGSGDNPYQRSIDFLGRIEELKKNGWTETPDNIKNEFGLTTTQYRAQKGLAKDERRKYRVATAKSLKEDGLGPTEIGRKLGISESTVRSLFNERSEARMNEAKKTADFIKSQIEAKGMIDIGNGVERELNISKERLNQALAILEADGYPVYGGRVSQATNPGQKTTIKVICPPGTEHKEIYNYENVHSLNDYISRDGGDTYEKKFHFPASMDSKRLMIRYSEDGGLEKDGVIELRRGVEDLSLGNSRYSQVRILVDGNRYLKGMAVYSDDMPDGVDVIFNTNKSKSVAKMDVLKKIKDDPDNPFGSTIKDADQGGQYWYTDKNGERKLGLINKRADEGDWTEWKDKIPAQFLSKQSLTLAKKQLNLAIADKTDEYNDILALTNPTIKKHLLSKFADECDSAAVHLQAAALPGQKYHVILPVNSLKDNEVYAPGYTPGTKLALIRYPHGGTFEIPVLTVTDKNETARKLIGKDSIDAVCINGKVAARLSGADFDGDTVMCIPTDDKAGKVHIKSTKSLGLEDFDPKLEYKIPDGDTKTKRMRNTQTEMGTISNLITDMTLKGASREELARAVRHSMVVIDAEKHDLDYKQSELDNNIAGLKKEYQNGGASTLISRSKGQKTVDKRQGSPLINLKGKDWYDPNRPEGALIWKTADDLEYSYTRINKRTGQPVTITRHRTQKSTQMAETDDARTLISDADTPMEHAYADYANSMKDLANRARVELSRTGKVAYNATAKKVYSEEVKSLENKLNTALLNAPRERQAQLRTSASVQSRVREVEARLRAENPNASNRDINKMIRKEVDTKKLGQQALTKYRQEVDAVSRRDRSIKITDREWEAIQAGAISENKLKQILNNADIDELRQRATPRTTTSISAAKANRIRALSGSNYSIGEIAKILGLSTSTVSNYLKGGN
jgi:DNA-binding CsgD family transcriptional regulator|nr:MAG TPA: RNA dependent RNA polymerase [Caudoviricetes sp.]